MQKVVSVEGFADEINLVPGIAAVMDMATFDCVLNQGYQAEFRMPERVSIFEVREHLIRAHDRDHHHRFQTTTAGVRSKVWMLANRPYSCHYATIVLHGRRYLYVEVDPFNVAGAVLVQ